jgi:hypothetical protein
LMCRDDTPKPGAGVYSGPMPTNNVAPITSTPTTTCLKVDSVEWKVFVVLMREQGRSASDAVRQMVRDTVNEHNRGRQHAGQPRG